MKFSKCFDVILLSVISVVIACLICFVCLFDTSITVASALVDTSGGTVLYDGCTDPLQDLRGFSEFNEDDFPQDNSDYSLTVIQIAESVGKELFLYVYQPYIGRYDLDAKYVNISQSSGVMYYERYSVTLVSYNGVFKKYVVDDFVCPDSDDYYVDISSISRTYYQTLDGQDIDSKVGSTELKAFDVSQDWEVFVADDGSKGYFLTESRTIEVTSFVSWFRIHTEDKDKTFRSRHYWQQYYFLAFDSNVDIDYVYDADVSFIFTSYDVAGTYSGKSFQNLHLENPIPDYTYYQAPKHLTCDGYEEQTSKYKRKKTVTFRFPQISSADGFFDMCLDTISESEVVDIESYAVDPDLEELVNSMQYVLLFHSFVGECCNDFGSTSVYGTYDTVSEVSLMHLTYYYNDEVYDVGVISDTMNPTTDNKGGSAAEVTVEKTESSCSKNVKRFLTVFLVVLLVVVIVVIIVWLVRKSRHGGGNSGSNITINIPGLDGSGGSSAPPEIPPDGDIDFGDDSVTSDNTHVSSSFGGGTSRGVSSGSKSASGNKNSGSRKS